MLHLKRGTDNYSYLRESTSSSAENSHNFEETVVGTGPPLIVFIIPRLVLIAHALRLIYVNRMLINPILPQGGSTDIKVELSQPEGIASRPIG